jgi:hypothetical protein
MFRLFIPLLENIVIHAGTILGADAFYYKKKRLKDMINYFLVEEWFIQR